MFALSPAVASVLVAGQTALSGDITPEQVSTCLFKRQFTSGELIGQFVKNPVFQFVPTVILQNKQYVGQIIGSPAVPVCDEFQYNERGYGNDTNMDPRRQFDLSSVLIGFSKSNHRHDSMALRPLNRSVWSFDFAERHQIHYCAAPVDEAVFCARATKGCISAG
jgi:hypothetical protein